MKWLLPPHSRRNIQHCFVCLEDASHLSQVSINTSQNYAFAAQWYVGRPSGPNSRLLMLPPSNALLCRGKRYQRGVLDDRGAIRERQFPDLGVVQAPAFHNSISGFDPRETQRAGGSISNPMKIRAPAMPLCSHETRRGHRLPEATRAGA
jgi:hypothetical protein